MEHFGNQGSRKRKKTTRGSDDEEEWKDTAPKKKVGKPEKKKAKSKKELAAERRAQKQEELPEGFVDDLQDEFAAEKQREQGNDATDAYRQKLLAKTTQSQRDVDRAAYTLAQLEGKRTCTAIGVEDRGAMGEAHLHLFANVPDNKLTPDMQDMIAATTDPRARKKLLQRLDALKNPSRLPQNEANAEKRENAHQQYKATNKRRLDKALRYLDKKQVDGKHVETPDMSTEKEIHAEHRATQWGAEQNVKFSALGISKLCCSKCWKGLQAADTAKIHSNLATGTHGKTYDSKNGWPFPPYLLDDDTALKAFLGGDAYDAFDGCEEDCRKKCIDYIEKEKFDIGAQNTTDIVSSQEDFEYEYEDEDEEKEEEDEEEKEEEDEEEEGSQ